MKNIVGFVCSFGVYKYLSQNNLISIFDDCIETNKCLGGRREFVWKDKDLSSLLENGLSVVMDKMHPEEYCIFEITSFIQRHGEITCSDYMDYLRKKYL